MYVYAQTRGKLLEQFADAQRIKTIAKRHYLKQVSCRKRAERDGMCVKWHYNFIERWDADWYPYSSGLDVEVSGPDNEATKSLISDICAYADATWLKSAKAQKSSACL